ncbi:MAG: biotin--[acetyl-CoA-carboxylase] ligase, partial [Nitrosopumilaceae archaeon]|nr:biotin--[acetyl-CoA-carboxylase] ligase [Nitrosopumilaceae archaeon]
MSKYNKDLIYSKITNHHIGSKLIILDEVDSTNKYALSLLGNKPCVSGTVVVADSQYAGKGRLDRSWYSPKGVNLYLSVILMPGIKTEEVNILTFISSVATVNT